MATSVILRRISDGYVVKDDYPAKYFDTAALFFGLGDVLGLEFVEDVSWHFTPTGREWHVQFKRLKSGFYKKKRFTATLKFTGRSSFEFDTISFGEHHPAEFKGELRPMDVISYSTSGEIKDARLDKPYATDICGILRLIHSQLVSGRLMLAKLFDELEDTDHYWLNKERGAIFHWRVYSKHHPYTHGTICFHKGLVAFPKITLSPDPSGFRHYGVGSGGYVDPALLGRAYPNVRYLGSILEELFAREPVEEYS